MEHMDKFIRFVYGLEVYLHLLPRITFWSIPITIYKLFRNDPEMALILKSKESIPQSRIPVKGQGNSPWAPVDEATACYKLL